MRSPANAPDSASFAPNGPNARARSKAALDLPLPDLKDTRRTPAEVWEQFFAEKKPTAEDLQRILSQLHELKRHEHVIACIETAIIRGEGKPWMYEVLALSMEIAGRPREEIERVLLSRIDFTAADVPSMLYSAAYLVRFGGERQALQLYRQASQLDSNRPEPYVLGLKLARKSKDADAIRWAAAGILTNVWGDDYQELHRQAENAAADSRKQLIAEGQSEKVRELDEALDQARQRDLVIRLTWAGDGDLDLVVEEPPGTVCAFDNRRTRGGGILAHDGYGPSPKNCYEEYLCPVGVPGDYRVHVRHIGGSIVGKRAQLTVIQSQGSPKELSRTFTVPLDESDKVIRIPLENGRRKELAPEIRKAAWEERAPRGRRSLIQMVGGLSEEDRRAARNFDRTRDRQGRVVAPTGGANVGYQPVISVLSEGATLSALAVISGDRRYVRISTVPSFTSITDVFTFTFQGGAPSDGSQGQPTGTPAGNR